VVEAKLDTVVHEAFALHPLARPRVFDQFGDPVFDHARSNALLDVLATATFKDDVVDSFSLEQMPQEQARGTGTDDDHLRTQFLH
jgi:hypothetical protein